jgi:hypothetical protein
VGETSSVRESSEGFPDGALFWKQSASETFAPQTDNCQYMATKYFVNEIGAK